MTPEQQIAAQEKQIMALQAEIAALKSVASEESLDEIAKAMKKARDASQRIVTTLEVMEQELSQEWLEVRRIVRERVRRAIKEAV